MPICQSVASVILKLDGDADKEAEVGDRIYLPNSLTLLASDSQTSRQQQTKGFCKMAARSVLNTRDSMFSGL